MNSSAYYEGKAHELITEAGRSREEGDNVSYCDNLRKCIQVLCLTIAKAEQPDA